MHNCNSSNKTFRSYWSPRCISDIVNTIECAIPLCWPRKVANVKYIYASSEESCAATQKCTSSWRPDLFSMVAQRVASPILSHCWRDSGHCWSMRRVFNGQWSLQKNQWGASLLASTPQGWRLGHLPHLSPSKSVTVCHLTCMYLNVCKGPPHI